MLNVSDIQHFSVGDGEGIRTTLFLKGCNLRCPWCHNPETIHPEHTSIFYPESGKSAEYGRQMSPEELFPILTRDSAFFAQSGGGVTVSGGEPLLQSRALIPLLKMLKDAGINVIIDTAGALPSSHLEDVMPYTDTFFVDWKSPHSSIYRDIVGGSLEAVERNVALLISRGASLRIRIPVIPGVNDSESDARISREKLMALGVLRVDLLPFHRLGSGKYRALGLDYPFAETEPPSKDKMNALAAIYSECFETSVEY